MNLVPGLGIEPRTRGFSKLVSGLISFTRANLHLNLLTGSTLVRLSHRFIYIFQLSSSLQVRPVAIHAALLRVPNCSITSFAAIAAIAAVSSTSLALIELTMVRNLSCSSVR